MQFVKAAILTATLAIAATSVTSDKQSHVSTLPAMSEETQRILTMVRLCIKGCTPRPEVGVVTFAQLEQLPHAMPLQLWHSDPSEAVDPERLSIISLTIEKIDTSTSSNSDSDDAFSWRITACKTTTTPISLTMHTPVTMLHVNQEVPMARKILDGYTQRRLSRALLVSDDEMRYRSGEIETSPARANGRVVLRLTTAFVTTISQELWLAFLKANA